MMDDIWVVIGCIAVIVIGVAVIAYILFRTPKAPASFGDTPGIDLGEMPLAEETADEKMTEETNVDEQAKE